MPCKFAHKANGLYGGWDFVNGWGLFHLGDFLGCFALTAERQAPQLLDNKKHLACIPGALCASFAVLCCLWKLAKSAAAVQAILYTITTARPMATLPEMIWWVKTRRNNQLPESIFVIGERAFFAQLCAFCYQRKECVEIGMVAFFNMQIQLTACRDCCKTIEQNITKNWEHKGLPLRKEDWSMRNEKYVQKPDEPWCAPYRRYHMYGYIYFLFDLELRGALKHLVLARCFLLHNFQPLTPKRVIVYTYL